MLLRLQRLLLLRAAVDARLSQYGSKDLGLPISLQILLLWQLCDWLWRIMLRLLLLQAALLNQCVNLLI